MYYEFSHFEFSFHFNYIYVNLKKIYRTKNPSDKKIMLKAQKLQKEKHSLNVLYMICYKKLQPLFSIFLCTIISLNARAFFYMIFFFYTGKLFLFYIFYFTIIFFVVIIIEVDR